MSKNAPAPVLVQNGNHYFLYPEPVRQPHPQQARAPTEAVRALQQSVAAAGAPPKLNTRGTAPNSNTTGFVIANGSSRALPLNISGHTGNTNGLQNTVPRNTEKKSKKKKQQPPPALNLSLPPRPPSSGPRASTPLGVDNNVGPGFTNAPEEYGPFTPTKINRGSQENPRSPDGGSQMMITKSLPPSVIMGYSELAINSRATSDDSQLLNRVPAGLSLPISPNRTAA